MLSFFYIAFFLENIEGKNCGGYKIIIYRRCRRKTGDERFKNLFTGIYQ